ncbi:hypothetical protein ACOMHN_049409 [Nucella lapillus]
MSATCIIVIVALMLVTCQSFDDSKLWYLGSYGDGHKMGLSGNGAYCMGGPGVVFSSLSLRHLVPHLPHCHVTAVTTHEDIELGRCVQRHLNISCIRDEMTRIYFRQKFTYLDHLPYNIFSVTVHPFKKHKDMWNIHFAFKEHHVKDLRRRQQKLKNDMMEMDKLVERQDVSSGTLPKPGQSPGQQHDHMTVKTVPHGLDHRKTLAASETAEADKEDQKEGQFLYRVALNVKPNTAYAPVVFSQFSPQTVCFGQTRCRPQLFNFSQDSGLWRAFGFGMMCIRAEDFEKCVAKGVEIFRAADTGLVHVYHKKSSDGHLPSDQMAMCPTSDWNLYGSEAKLSQMMMDIENKKTSS